MRALIVAALFTSAVLTKAPTVQGAGPFPSDQQVLTFIGDTIDWYRQLPTAQRIGSDPADLFFLEDDRPTAVEIVRLSLQFGKAVAAIQIPRSAPDPPASTARDATATSEVRYLTTAKAKVDEDAQDAAGQLKSVAEARLAARGVERKKLNSQMADIRTRIQVLNAISGKYQDLLEYVRTVTADRDPQTTLAVLVEDLERTAPDAAGGAPSPKISLPPSDPARAGYGIMGSISQVSALSRKKQIISAAIDRTDALTRSLLNVRNPFRETFQKRFRALSLDGKSVDVLEEQQSRLAEMVAQVQTTSAAISALVKQQSLLNLYKSHLVEWRSEIQMEYRAAWKALIIRLAVLAAAIAALLGINVVLRRLTRAHVHDLETRQMVLLGERILLWVIIIAVVLFVFAFNPSSLATFLGLVTAGLAVGLHDVFLVIGGRLLLARRFRIRVGDRVEIAGVKGEVTRLGLMEFALNEIDAVSGQRTGRVVFFANSYVFVSPATPLFRQLSAPA
jgi:hypothetical protein